MHGAPRSVWPTHRLRRLGSFRLSLLQHLEVRNSLQLCEACDSVYNFLIDFFIYKARLGRREKGSSRVPSAQGWRWQDAGTPAHHRKSPVARDLELSLLFPAPGGPG